MVEMVNFTGYCLKRRTLHIIHTTLVRKHKSLHQLGFYCRIFSSSKLSNRSSFKSKKEEQRLERVCLLVVLVHMHSCL